jgi:hypothetical protein
MHFPFDFKIIKTEFPKNKYNEIKYIYLFDFEDA